METFNTKILIIDGDRTLLQLLRTRFNNLGYKVILASNGKEALTSFRDEKPDLVVLDILLPKLNGYEVCRKIRLVSPVPIIILTTLNKLSDRIIGLELGADDYITKPFSPPELEVRILALLRRSNFQKVFNPLKKRNGLKINNLLINMDDKFISKNNVKIKLTDIQYSLLKFLIKNEGKELSRTTILTNIWGYTPERAVDNRIVDVHIARLRSKIEEDSSKPGLIITVRGTGYVFMKRN